MIRKDGVYIANFYWGTFLKKTLSLPNFPQELYSTKITKGK